MAGTYAYGQQVTGKEVRIAVKAAVQWLLGEQRIDGTWGGYERYQGGTTSLATLALLNAGVPADNEQMKAAIRVVRNCPLNFTYVVAIKIQVLAAADAVKYRQEIQAGADWLAKAQHTSGMWGYGRSKVGHSDFSNTQFAMLGLHEASRAGAAGTRPSCRMGVGVTGPICAAVRGA